MTTNIRFVPFRRTTSVPLGPKLTEFVSSALDQHPEQFKDDLDALDKLRADIVALDASRGCLERLVRYHAQLLSLSGKLAIDVRVLSRIPLFTKQT